MAEETAAPAGNASDAGAAESVVAAAAPAAAPAAQPDAAKTGDNGEGAPAAEKPAEGQGAAKPEGEAAKPDGEAQEPKEGEEAAKPEGAPAEYADFKAPEGAQVGDSLPANLKALAKELNLTQEQAQKVFDLGVQQAGDMAVRSNEAMAAQRTAWADQSKADPEFGGDKLTENLAIANKALKTFASDTLIELLTGSGLGNHPEFIRAFLKIGKAINEDTIVTGNGDKGGRASRGDRSEGAIAKRMYAGMN